MDGFSEGLEGGSDSLGQTRSVEGAKATEVGGGTINWRSY